MIFQFSSVYYFTHVHASLKNIIARLEPYSILRNDYSVYRIVLLYSNKNKKSTNFQNSFLSIHCTIYATLINTYCVNIYLIYNQINQIRILYRIICNKSHARKENLDKTTQPFIY